MLNTIIGAGETEMSKTITVLIAHSILRVLFTPLTDEETDSFMVGTWLGETETPTESVWPEFLQISSIL